MTIKGKPIMKKIMEDEDIKGLEEEIDSAVDQLFVEKKGKLDESLLMESPIPETPYPMEKSFEETESSLRPPSILPPFSKPIEKMETQLLSLEWEITKENLENTKEEVLRLREISKEKPDIISILNLMEKVLHPMMENEENIHPSMIKFLLDSKETIKLLMRKETDSEINVYKQLAYAGIQARFSRLEGIQGIKTKQPPLSLGEEIGRPEIPVGGEKQIEEMLNKMNLFSEKMDEIMKKIEDYLSKLGQPTIKSTEELVEMRPQPLNITVFKVDEKLFGVESNKVLKLFKVPDTFHEKYSNRQKIRLRDFEVKMIDLKKIFSIQEGDRKGEIKILTVKDDGEYKGLMVDQVLKKLSTHSDIGGEYGEYFLGMIHWTYQEHPVEIPILDLKKF